LWLVPTVIGLLGIYLRAARAKEEKLSTSAVAEAYERYRSRTGYLFPNPVKIITSR
jgi:protein-S-isoprenylcysteine O-methyltransferase Ste14